MLIIHLRRLNYPVSLLLNLLKQLLICIILDLYFRSRSWRSGTRCGCKTDWLWVRSPLEEMKYLLKVIFPFFALVSRLSAALSSATQHATMPPEFSRKWGTECLNTTFPLPTLLCAGYTVKQFFFKAM